VRERGGALPSAIHSLVAGRLIAIEGIDGSGKTTQARLLVEALARAGHRTVATKEPTDSRFTQRIRELADRAERAAPEEELQLFCDDRAEHAEKLLLPSLASGAVVVTDRYYLSTVAYQGARGLDPAKILADSEARFPVPDLAILVEMPAALGLERVRARGKKIDVAFERIEYLEGVARVFAAIDRPYLVRIDGAVAIDAVHAAIADALRARDYFAGAK
jgi:dTMP kinase